MTEPPTRPSVTKSNGGVRPAAGRPPGPEDAPVKDGVVEISSSAKSAPVDVDQSQEFAFTTGFRRAMIALGSQPAAVRDSSREDPTLPSYRRRRALGAAPPPADAPTPVEPSQARFRERKSRRAAVVLTVAALGGIAGLVFAYVKRTEHAATEPRPLSTLSATAAALAPSAPFPAPARAGERAAGVPRVAGSGSGSARPNGAPAEPRDRAGAPKRPAPSGDGLWFPPE